MNFKDWKVGTYKNFEDPTYYNEPSKYCEICDIEEEKLILQKIQIFAKIVTKKKKKKKQTNNN